MGSPSAPIADSGESEPHVTKGSGMGDDKLNLLHWMRKEASGLAYTTLELVEAEEQQGHGVEIRQPGGKGPMGGWRSLTST
jgi:hypothetical protein